MKKLIIILTVLISSMTFSMDLEEISIIQDVYSQLDNLNIHQMSATTMRTYLSMREQLQEFISNAEYYNFDDIYEYIELVQDFIIEN